MEKQTRKYKKNAKTINKKNKTKKPNDSYADFEKGLMRSEEMSTQINTINNELNINDVNLTQNNDSFINFTLNLKIPVPAARREQLLNTFTENLSSLNLSNVTINNQEKNVNTNEFVFPKPIKVENLDEVDNRLSAETYLERVKNEYGINIEEAHRLTNIKREEEDFLSVISDIGSSTVICSDQVPNLNDKRLKKLPFNKIDGNGSFYVRTKVNSDENIVGSNQELGREINRENLIIDDEKIESVENFNDVNNEKMEISETEIQDYSLKETINDYNDVTNSLHDVSEMVKDEDIDRAEDSKDFQIKILEDIVISQMVTPSAKKLLNLNYNQTLETLNLLNSTSNQSQSQNENFNNENENENEINIKLNDSNNEINENEQTNDQNDVESNNSSLSTVKVEVEFYEDLENEGKVTLDKAVTLETVNQEEDFTKSTQETTKTLSISERRELKKEKKRFNEMAANDSVGFINTTDPMTTHEIIDIVMDMISVNKSENVESENLNLKQELNESHLNVNEIKEERCECKNEEVNEVKYVFSDSSSDNFQKYLQRGGRRDDILSDTSDEFSCEENKNLKKNKIKKKKIRKNKNDRKSNLIESNFISSSSSDLSSDEDEEEINVNRNKIKSKNIPKSFKNQQEKLTLNKNSQTSKNFEQGKKSLSPLRDENINLSSDSYESKETISSNNLQKNVKAANKNKKNDKKLPLNSSKEKHIKLKESKEIKKDILTDSSSSGPKVSSNENEIKSKVEELKKALSKKSNKKQIDKQKTLSNINKDSDLKISKEINKDILSDSSESNFEGSNKPSSKTLEKTVNLNLKNPINQKNSNKESFTSKSNTSKDKNLKFKNSKESKDILIDSSSSDGETIPLNNQEVKLEYSKENEEDILTDSSSSDPKKVSSKEIKSEQEKLKKNLSKKSSKNQIDRHNILSNINKDNDIKISKEINKDILSDSSESNFDENNKLPSKTLDKTVKSFNKNNNKESFTSKSNTFNDKNVKFINSKESKKDILIDSSSSDNETIPLNKKEVKLANSKESKEDILSDSSESNFDENNKPSSKSLEETVKSTNKTNNKESSTSKSNTSKDKNVKFKNSKENREDILIDSSSSDNETIPLNNKDVKLEDLEKSKEDVLTHSSSSNSKRVSSNQKEIKRESEELQKNKSKKSTKKPTNKQKDSSNINEGNKISISEVNNKDNLLISSEPKFDQNNKTKTVENFTKSINKNNDKKSSTNTSKDKIIQLKNFKENKNDISIDLCSSENETIPLNNKEIKLENSKESKEGILTDSSSFPEEISSKKQEIKNKQEELQKSQPKKSNKKPNDKQKNISNTYKENNIKDAEDINKDIYNILSSSSESQFHENNKPKTVEHFTKSINKSHDKKSSTNTSKDKRCKNSFKSSLNEEEINDSEDLKKNQSKSLIKKPTDEQKFLKESKKDISTDSSSSDNEKINSLKEIKNDILSDSSSSDEVTSKIKSIENITRKSLNLIESKKNTSKKSSIERNKNILLLKKSKDKQKTSKETKKYTLSDSSSNEENIPRKNQKLNKKLIKRVNNKQSLKPKIEYSSSSEEEEKEEKPHLTKKIQNIKDLKTINPPLIDSSSDSEKTQRKSLNQNPQNTNKNSPKNIKHNISLDSLSDSDENLPTNSKNNKQSDYDSDEELLMLRESLCKRKSLSVHHNEIFTSSKITEIKIKDTNKNDNKSYNRLTIKNKESHLTTKNKDSHLITKNKESDLDLNKKNLMIQGIETFKPSKINDRKEDTINKERNVEEPMNTQEVLDFVMDVYNNHYENNKKEDNLTKINKMGSKNKDLGKKNVEGSKNEEVKNNSQELRIERTINEVIEKVTMMSNDENEDNRNEEEERKGQNDAQKDNMNIKSDSVVEKKNQKFTRRKPTPNLKKKTNEEETLDDFKTSTPINTPNKSHLKEIIENIPSLLMQKSKMETEISKQNTSKKSNVKETTKNIPSLDTDLISNEILTQDILGIVMDAFDENENKKKEEKNEENQENEVIQKDKTNIKNDSVTEKKNQKFTRRKPTPKLIQKSAKEAETNKQEILEKFQTSTPTTTLKKSNVKETIKNVPSSDTDLISNEILTQDILGIVMEALDENQKKADDENRDNEELQKEKTNIKEDSFSEKKKQSCTKKKSISNLVQNSKTGINQQENNPESNEIATQDILGIVMDALDENEDKKKDEENEDKLIQKDNTNIKNDSSNNKKKQSCTKKKNSNSVQNTKTETNKQEEKNQDTNEIATQEILGIVEDVFSENEKKMNEELNKSTAKVKVQPKKSTVSNKKKSVKEDKGDKMINKESDLNLKKDEREQESDSDDNEKKQEEKDGNISLERRRSPRIKLIKKDDVSNTFKNVKETTPIRKKSEDKSGKAKSKSSNKIQKETKNDLDENKSEDDSSLTKIIEEIDLSIRSNLEGEKSKKTSLEEKTKIPDKEKDGSIHNNNEKCLEGRTKSPSFDKNAEITSSTKKLKDKSGKLKRKSSNKIEKESTHNLDENKSKDDSSTIKINKDTDSSDQNKSNLEEEKSKMTSLGEEKIKKTSSKEENKIQETFEKDNISIDTNNEKQSQTLNKNLNDVNLKGDLNKETTENVDENEENNSKKRKVEKPKTLPKNKRGDKIKVKFDFKKFREKENKKVKEEKKNSIVDYFKNESNATITREDEPNRLSSKQNESLFNQRENEGKENTKTPSELVMIQERTGKDDLLKTNHEQSKTIQEEPNKSSSSKQSEILSNQRDNEEKGNEKTPNELNPRTGKDDLVKRNFEESKTIQEEPNKSLSSKQIESLLNQRENEEKENKKIPSELNSRTGKDDLLKTNVEESKTYQEEPSKPLNPKQNETSTDLKENYKKDNKKSPIKGKKEIKHNIKRNSPRIKKLQSDPKSQLTNTQTSEDIIPNSQLNTSEQNKNSQFSNVSIPITSQDILNQQNEISLTKNTHEKIQEDQNQTLKEIENLDNAITNQIETELINLSSQQMEPDTSLSLILPETNVEECMRSVGIELSDSLIVHCGQNISELDTTINSEKSTRKNIDRVKRKLVDKNESSSSKKFKSQRSTVAEKRPKELPEKVNEILNVPKTDFSNESISSTPKNPKKKHKKGYKEKLKDLVMKTVEAALERKLGKKRKLKSKKSKPSKRFKRIALTKDSSESSSDDCDDNTERSLNEDSSSDSEDNSKQLIKSTSNKKLKQRKINEMIEKQLNRIKKTENELLKKNEKLSTKHSNQLDPSSSSEEENDISLNKRRKSSSSLNQYSPDKRKERILDCLDKIKNTNLHKSHEENSSRRNEDEENNDSESSDLDPREISNEYVDTMREARFHLKALSSPNEVIRNLKVKIDFEVPKIHQIATKLVSNPSKMQYMKLIKEGVKVKTEHFSEKEDFLIYSNFSRFCEVHKLDDDPLPFLNIGTDSLLPQSQKLRFVQYLGKGLEDRTLHSIHLRFQKLMSTRKLEGFTPEEDEVILNYQTNLRRSKNKLIALEFILRRSRTLILKRYDELIKNKKCEDVDN